MFNSLIKETIAKIAISNLHFAIYTSVSPFRNLHSISHFSLTACSCTQSVWRTVRKVKMKNFLWVLLLR